MSRMWWAIVLAAVGVGFVVLVAVLGTRNSESKTEAVSNLCGSLQNLEASVKSLTSLSSSSSMDDFQSDVDAVQSDWDQVKTDIQDVQDAPSGELDSAWDDFSAAVKDVPNDASVSDAVSDVTDSGQALVSAAQSTASEINCSS
jgi:hypothetical protein